MAALDDINARAEAAPGFVWRLQSDSGNATDIRVSEDPNFLVNISVWATIESLFDFVYRSAHTAVMARRRRWFDRRYPPPGELGGPEDMKPEPYCAGWC
jgi:Domain of unknown function (DUF3291)